MDKNEELNNEENFPIGDLNSEAQSASESSYLPLPEPLIPQHVASNGSPVDNASHTFTPEELSVEKIDPALIQTPMADEKTFCQQF